jgi:phosphatidyl-myo-inositol dimannoside synthase
VEPDLLVVTRNFPPQRGGLEAYSYHLASELSRQMPLRLIALKKPKVHLSWFLPSAFVRSLFLVRLRGVCRVHLCDASLAPFGVMLKRLSTARVTVSAHGLDVTFPHPVYQRLIPACLRMLDRVICVSNATRVECLRRALPESLCCVIPNGVDIRELELNESTEETQRYLAAALGHDLRGRKVLVTVGRLVKRKGVAWFLENVMPMLDESYIYVVVGSGPEAGAILATVKRNRLVGRALLVGSQPDLVRNRLLHAAHAFIMPNITVSGDVEGFGIAALEAGACGSPVIASRLQGIPDAVVDGVTGYLVPPEDARAFATCISSLDMDRDEVRRAALARFNWERIGVLYARELTDCEPAARWGGQGVAPETRTFRTQAPL